MADIDTKVRNKTDAQKGGISVTTEIEPEEYLTPRYVRLRLMMNGSIPSPPSYTLLVLYHGEIVLEDTWCDGSQLETDDTWYDGSQVETDFMPINIRGTGNADIAANQPLIFILRAVGTKPAKNPDPLQHHDNRAGGTVDLLPLLLGQEDVNTNLSLVFIETGEPTGLTVDVFAHAGVGFDERVPLTLTMISAHCLPPPIKDGTVYIAAIGLDELKEPLDAQFGMSLSTATAKKTFWSAASTFGYGGCTANNVPIDDYYIPKNLKPTESPVSAYWFAMTRILVDPYMLQERLQRPFHIEVAGVPRTGKNEARGRYMGSVDARVLLEPGQFGVTICSKLIFYNEPELSPGMHPVLNFPPTSAKASARLATGEVIDADGNSAYVIIRFDLTEAVTRKVRLVTLFDTLGYPPPDAATRPKDELYVDPPPEDPNIDVRRIRKESGALSVHKELSRLACRVSDPINQGIKRTAANRLLMRVRAMLKQFSPGDCSQVIWQDTVTSQHAASRRAVTASFAPQPPAPRAPARFAGTRARMANKAHIDEKHTETNLKISPIDPKALMAKALRCVEAREDSEALTYLQTALSAQKRNRFILWAFGALQFDKGEQEFKRTAAALQIAVKGDHSDGTANAIGWAALHTLYHYQGNQPAAFVAVKRMRKSYELKQEWKGFISRWENGSGQEEVFWFPQLVSSEYPLIIAASFFLSLRGYKFSELLLKCFEKQCGTCGSRFGLKTRDCPDVVYLRAASMLLRRFYDDALEEIDKGIKKFGPCGMFSQIRSACLLAAQGWDGTCENAFDETERFGVEPGAAILIEAALGGMRTNPKAALQRAARAHKMAPCAFSALVIGRVYFRLDEPDLAERWAAAAVKLEPLLADGWAFLAILALYQQNLNKSQAMLRTAKQAGKISDDLQDDLKRISAIVHVESVPESLMKDLCLCDYY